MKCFILSFFIYVLCFISSDLCSSYQYAGELCKAKWKRMSDSCRYAKSVSCPCFTLLRPNCKALFVHSGLPLPRKTVSRVSGGILCKQLPPEFKCSVMVCDAHCSEGFRAALWHAAVNSDQYLSVFWRWNSNQVVNKKSFMGRVVLNLRLKAGNWGTDSGFSWLYILHHLPTSEVEL